MKADNMVTSLDLIRFIDNSPTAFSACKNIEESLTNAGFVKLNEEDVWNIEPNGKYFVSRNQTATIAFVAGSQKPEESGFNLIGTHTDSPAFKIKLNSEKYFDGYTTVNVEPYGGPILSTWLDRELSIAGRVVYKKDDKFISEIIDFEEPIAIIPNLAIHLNREINKGFKYNAHTHLKAVLSTSENKAGLLKSKIANLLKINIDQIHACDLFLYDATPGKIIGFENEFIVCPRQDNLSMTHAALKAIEACINPEKTAIALFYDNEEIGSRTMQGADSVFAESILKRLCVSNENYFRAMAKSYLVSADMAHAMHPSYREKHDAEHSPYINKGPVIKLNGNYRYATTAVTANFFAQLCNESEVNVQTMMNRADMPCGSTIGPMSSAKLGVKTVDVGSPVWAMHSIRETGGTADHADMIAVFKTFYNK